MALAIGCYCQVITHFQVAIDDFLKGGCQKPFFMGILGLQFQGVPTHHPPPPPVRFPSLHLVVGEPDYPHPPVHRQKSTRNKFADWGGTPLAPLPLFKDEFSKKRF